MEHGTDKPPEQPSPAQPQPNSILREPATVQTCAEDYAAGAEIRAVMARQEARAGR